MFTRCWKAQSAVYCQPSRPARVPLYEVVWCGVVAYLQVYMHVVQGLPTPQMPQETLQLGSFRLGINGGQHRCLQAATLPSTSPNDKHGAASETEVLHSVETWLQGYCNMWPNQPVGDSVAQVLHDKACATRSRRAASNAPQMQGHDHSSAVQHS